MIKNICFINSYNNEKYIRDCLQSVFSQTHPFDEVILVDDGSSDSSLEIITEFRKIYPHLKLHQKNNEGQFSSFNIALPLIPDNSQIFLLDGDDIYPKDYLSLVLNQINRDSWDFAFCEQQRFSDSCSPPSSALINQSPPYFLESTSALARSRGCWIGNPTSCLSLSSDLYKKIFPYPYTQDKSFWVDNLMIYAASILGAKKSISPGLELGGELTREITVKSAIHQRMWPAGSLLLVELLRGTVESLVFLGIPALWSFFRSTRSWACTGKRD
jgi:glycosyltransferase involved in cell wall biosynthesis